MPKFLKSAANWTGWFKDQVTEIAFVGRSNVGKSSLINALANEKIAITSNTPGRTQLTNFYDFKNFRLVDLPGYGFAKISKQQQEKISLMIDEFLTTNKNLRAVFQICDLNVVTQSDVEMSDYLKSRFDNHYIILNKSDKVNKEYYKKNVVKIAEYLKIDPDNLVPVSAKNKTNLTQIWTIINCILKDVK